MLFPLLVALIAGRGLLLCAKHLFVASTIGCAGEIRPSKFDERCVGRRRANRITRGELARSARSADRFPEGAISQPGRLGNDESAADRGNGAGQRRLERPTSTELK
jgi:hypothetical protein